MPKRPEEYFAKVVLESYFPELYVNLQVTDKPDLQDLTHNIGIEVTNAEPEKHQRLTSCWLKALYSQNVKVREKCKACMLQKDDVPFQGVVQNMGVIYIEDLASIIKTAFCKKLEKLQNKDFRKFQQNDLFILTEVIFSKLNFEDINSPDDYLDFMIQNNNRETNKFDFVYFKLVGSVCQFNLKEKKYRIVDYNNGAVVNKANTIMEYYNYE